jgi:hypothetical protein
MNTSECRHLFANNMHAFDLSLYLVMSTVDVVRVRTGRLSMNGIEMMASLLVAAHRHRCVLQGAAADPRYRG